MRLLGIFLGIGILFVALVATASAEPLADAAAGKVTWEKSQCARCHGIAGEGGYGTPRAGDTRTAAQWITQVRTPRAIMPMFTEKQVSDADLTDMLDYMKTLPAVTGYTPPVSSAKAGDPPGKVVIAQKLCIACHGEKGPLVFFTSTNRAPTTEAVIKQLRSPRNRMPSFSVTQVSDADAAQVADYLAQEAKAAPAPLPKAGDPVSLGLIAALGAAFLAGGLAIRRFV